MTVRVTGSRERWLVVHAICVACVYVQDSNWESIVLRRRGPFFLSRGGAPSCVVLAANSSMAHAMFVWLCHAFLIRHLTRYRQRIRLF